MNDKEKIISLLDEFSNQKKWLHFFWQYDSRFLLIRPSGIPIDAKEFEQMITGDIFKKRQK